MTRERLIQMMDLILKCEYWGTSHRASIEIDNDGDHTIRVYPYVGQNNSKSTVYHCDDSRRLFYTSNEFVFDPNFDAAEARILQLLEEIKKVDEVEEVEE